MLFSLGWGVEVVIPMGIYYIKKAIQAKNIKEALRKEPKAPITDVWQEKPKKESNDQLTSAIGFQYLQDYED